MGTRPSGGRWVVGERARDPGDRVLALTLEELRLAREAGATALAFHEALEAPLDPAGEIVVRVPPRRGYSFVRLLEWWVCSALAGPSARVTWLALRKEGAPGVERILTGRGWEVERHREGSWLRLTGTPPSAGPRPEPERFTTELGGRTLTFTADWGVFSQEHIDPGAMLLFETAMAEAGGRTVVDVGCGYGPLAVGLTSVGAAPDAVASDVDSVALWLTACNAQAAGVEVACVLDDVPPEIDAAIYVCNFPTHIEGEAGRGLLRALAQRAKGSFLLFGTHASLEDRYRRRFENEGVACEVVATGSHSVLRVEPRSAKSSRSA